MTDQKTSQVMAALNCSVNGLSISGGLTGANYASTATGTGSSALGQMATTGATTTALYQPYNGTSLWHYWQNDYYPYVIRESYPVYIEKRAVDKGKQAFELLKALIDKKLLKLEKVSDFIEAMDTILKTL